MSERIVVTGGAGFIGSNLVAALNDRGRDDILIVDRLGENEKWRNLVGLAYDDYLNATEFLTELLDDALGPVEALFHLGACSDTTERDADYLLENNYRYTRILCEWCLRRGVRFIYASSGATYGDGGLGYSDDVALLPSLRPLNMYGYSKHMFDLWALRAGHLDEIVGLKYFNVYGPGEAHKGEMRSVVHKAFGWISERGGMELFKSNHPDYEDGKQLRDFIYVKDAVDVTLWFYDHPEASGLFNCGTGEARTWLDLAHAVFAAMEREPKIEFVEMPDHLKPKYQNYTRADVSKLRAAGYDTPFTSLEDGVKDYVRNYLMT